MTTLRIDARNYQDHDDCLAAAASDAATTYGFAGWDLSSRWEDDQRNTILVDLPMDAAAYTIIDDGQFKYPVLTADIESAGKSKADLRAMNGDEYTAWSQDVPMVKAVSVGTRECIDLCEALADAGADVWHIA